MDVVKTAAILLDGVDDTYYYFVFLTFARIISLTLILPPLISIFTKGQGLPQQQHAWEGGGEGGGGGSGFV